MERGSGGVGVGVGVSTPGRTRGGDTKGRIIDAAEEVVLRDGVARLTLEAAAAEAGLSKGGVLYHFPTRHALVAAMVESIIEEFDRDIESNMTHADGPGQYLRAYIRATMEPGATRPDRFGLAPPSAALRTAVGAQLGRWAGGS
jgi:AcrR family transcriptional regulator